MANFDLLVWEGGRSKRYASSDATMDFQTLRLVGPGPNSFLSISALDDNAFSFGNKQLTGVLDPTGPSHVATKSYVDSIAAGLDPKLAVRVVTAGVLPAYSYNNGIAGVGATLTATSPGSLNVAGIDGVTTLAQGDRVLVKDALVGYENGIYEITVLGDASTAWELTRAADFDGSPSNEVDGGEYVFVKEGTLFADTGWVVYSPDSAATIGTTPILWTQFSGAGTASLASLSDTTISSPGDNEVLYYDTDTNTWTHSFVTTDMIGLGEVKTNNIADGNVTAVKLGANSVTTVKIMDLNVTTAKLADDAVTEVKIGPMAVTEAKIGSSAVTTTKIADGNVTTDKIADNAVTSDKLADDAVDTAAIQANAVTTAKIAYNAVTSDLLADDAVDTAAIQANAVTSSKIAANAVDSLQLAANAVTTSELADDAVTEEKLGANAVTTAKIAYNAVTSNQLADDAVDTAAIQANAVTSSKIAADAVDSLQLAANAVTTAKIADGAVTEEKLGANAVTTAKIADEAVTQAKFKYTQSFTAVANVVTGDAVSYNATHIILASNGTSWNNNIGLVAENISAGNSGNVYVHIGATVGGYSGLVVGNSYYLSTTAGALTDDVSGFVAGSFVWEVGKAVSSSEIRLLPQFIVEL